VIEREEFFDRHAHSADAIQRAAYRLSDRLSIELVTADDVFGCRTTLLTDDREQADMTIHEFRAEVLDQVLRERIREETTGVRNVILALAFSKTGLTQQG